MKVRMRFLGAFHIRLRKNTRIIAKLLRANLARSSFRNIPMIKKLVDEKLVMLFILQINNFIQAEKEYITHFFSVCASWQLPLVCAALQQLVLGGPCQRSRTAEHQKPLH